MQHCADERRKLAAEWAHFHTVEKQRRERAEREVDSLLEKREGSIVSLAQVGQLQSGAGFFFFFSHSSSCALPVEASWD